jgi:O-antigen/teichoic acid export membrane protein
MFGNLLAVTLNIIFDVFFIFVFDWGMLGAALATSLAVTSTVILGISTTFRKKSNLKICFTYFNIKQILCIIKVGMSTFLNEVDVGVVTFVYNIVLIKISQNLATSRIAIYGIVVNISTIVLASINGISNAMQPIVSANSGAGKLFRVKRFTNLAVKWAIGMSIVLVVGIEWKAELLVKMFLEPDEAFLMQASYAVRVVSASYVLAAANMILVSYFQSIQATKQAIYFSFIRTFFLPVIYVIGGAFFLGSDGVWLSTVLVEATTIIVLAVVYRYYQRRRMKENLSQLNFYDIEKDVDSLDGIIEQLGADNLASYRETIEYCLKRDNDNEGIPMIIGLDDLTDANSVFYEGAKEDEDLSFTLAMGALLFTDLYDQTEGALEDGKPAIMPAMSALAEKFFRSEKFLEEDRVGILSYREALLEGKMLKGEENEQ